MRQGNFGSAAKLFSEAAEGRQRLLGSDHEDVQDSLYNRDLANQYAEAQ